MRKIFSFGGGNDDSEVEQENSPVLSDFANQLIMKLSLSLVNPLELAEDINEIIEKSLEVIDDVKKGEDKEEDVLTVSIGINIRDKESLSFLQELSEKFNHNIEENDPSNPLLSISIEDGKMNLVFSKEALAKLELEHNQEEQKGVESGILDMIVGMIMDRFAPSEEEQEEKRNKDVLGNIDLSFLKGCEISNKESDNINRPNISVDISAIHQSKSGQGRSG